MTSTSVDPRFPPELLSASAEARLSYFANKNLIVSHPQFEKTLKAVKDAIDPGLDQNVVNLIGPSGAGKTALTKLLVSKVNRGTLQHNPHDMVSAPAIWLEADASGEDEFDWKYFYVDLLQELHTPLINETLPLTSRSAGEIGVRETIEPEAPGTIPSIGALRHRAKAMIEARHTQLVVIDEAKSLFLVRPGLSDAARQIQLQRKAEVVRSLVNRTPATILLVGAFNLLESVNLTGALARRSNTVYFPPYEATLKGFTDYSVGFLGLLAHIPAIWELDTKKFLPILFEQALGQIGMTRHILHKWMRKSLQNGVPMDESLLLSCFFPKQTLKTLREELKEGKRQIDHISELEVINIPVDAGRTGTSR